MAFYFRKSLLLLLLCLFLFSCEKKFLEIVPIVEQVEDLSVKGGRNIRHFSFPSAATGYAASDTNFIYKTLNGGKNWDIVSFPNLITSRFSCSFLEFYDPLNGVCGMQDLSDPYPEYYVLITANGGTTWTITGNGPVAGITGNGKAYYCQYDSFRGTCLLKESTDNGKTFRNLITVFLREKLGKLKVIDNTVFVLDTDGLVTGYNPITSDTVKYYIGSLPHNRKINDYKFDKWVTVAACDVGIIKQNYLDYFTSLRIEYDEHEYNYYGVDSYNDLIVAVGEKTMATDMDVQDEYRWHEIFDTKGNGFTQTFYKIKFIDQHHFYVSGKNGLIWKMKI